MKIGFSEVAVELELPCQLAGYGTPRYAIEYDNNILVKCLTFKNEKETIHILISDILSFDKSICDSISNSFGKEEQIMFCATHTHCGPAGLWELNGTILSSCEFFLGSKNNKNIEALINACISSIKLSKRELHNFSYRTQSVKIDNVATNRNRPNEAGDDLCTIFEFKIENNGLVCLIQYACHPTVLNSSSNELNPDLFGSITSKLKNKYDWVGMVNGSAGDISTRHTKKSSTIGEIERLAKLFISQIENIQGEYKSLERITHFESKINVSLKEPRDEKLLMDELLVLEQKYTESNREIDFRKIESKKADINYSNHYCGLRNQEILINYLLFDKICFVFMPLELCSELSNLVKKTNKNVRFVSYANGYMVYLAAKKSYDLFEYESTNTSFKYGEGERVMDHVAEKLVSINN